MAENSPSTPSPKTSTLSQNPNIPTTLSPPNPPLKIDPILDKPQNNQLSSEPSPKNSNINGYSLIDSGMRYDASERILSLDGSNEVSGKNNQQSDDVLKENLSLDSREINQVSSDGNNVSGIQCKEILNFDGVSQVFGVFNAVPSDTSKVSVVQVEQNNEDFKGFSGEDGLDFNVEFDGNDEVSRVFDEVSVDSNKDSGIQMGEYIENFEGFDGNGRISNLQLSKDDVGFEYKDETDEFLELKNEVNVNKRANSSEILPGGSLESQSNDSLSEITSSKLKMLDGNSKNGDVVPYSMTMELIDETVVVDVSDKVGKKSGRRGKKGNSNANGARRKLKYTRKELEKLRFVNVKSQKKFWQEVYYGFAENVRKEYGELGRVKQNDYQAAGKRNKCYQGILGDSSSEIRNSIDVTCDGENSGEYGGDLVEWSEDDESDDEYHSIQRPAFKVEGEPDFESGSPEDGFEYLRRVRWEAAHIPKVKVVKPDNCKLTEQSVYMPKIPDIEKCPLHLVPLMEWEDEFIAEFSELRMVLSDLEDTTDAASVDPELIIFNSPECTKRTSKSQAPLEVPKGGPTLSTLLAMDSATRVRLLNKRISLFKSASKLSKDDCAWIFALCAVVETPLDADACASLRCLLRRCAKLRAEKHEFDDEVVMLNILVTIAGKIFRQSEN